MRLDGSQYPKLQDSKHIEPFWRSFQAVAKCQGMGNVLDPTYVPDPLEAGSQELFDYQNRFMYSVTISTFLLDNTKTYVREHSHDMDAQKVIGKLIQYMKDSPRTNMEINRITKYVSTMKLDGNWKGTAEQFLLHFKEQFRLLDDLTEVHERMAERLRRILLELAVSEVSYLKNIANNDEYQKVLSKTTAVNFEQYFNLLLAAAQRNSQVAGNAPSQRRSIYSHAQDGYG
jgi:hypothetical protein